MVDQSAFGQPVYQSQCLLVIQSLQAASSESSRVYQRFHSLFIFKPSGSSCIHWMVSSGYYSAYLCTYHCNPAKVVTLTAHVFGGGLTGLSLPLFLLLGEIQITKEQHVLWHKTKSIKTSESEAQQRVDSVDTKVHVCIWNYLSSHGQRWPERLSGREEMKKKNDK